MSIQPNGPDRRGNGPDANDETTERNLNRRNLILGASAAGAAAAAALVAAATPAGADTGDNLVLGQDNTASASTTLETTVGHGLEVTTYNDGDNGLFGIDASSGGGYGVAAYSSNGIGMYSYGAAAHLRLNPGPTAGAPTLGGFPGDFYVDSTGILYRCVVNGTPGTWVPMYTTVPLASPVRVIDTRNGTGGISGPLTADSTATSSDITSLAGIPPASVAVLGTVTLVATGQNLPGAGYLTVFPAGTSVPSTSNVNADTGHAIASGLTLALGKAANAGKVSFFASFASHALLDVTAYII